MKLGFNFIITALLAVVVLTACGQKSKGVVRITTDPGDAQIFIDGKPKGNSPSAPGQFLTVSLPAGKHVIEALIPVDAETEQYAKKDFFAAADTIQNLILELESQLTKAEKAAQAKRELRQKKLDAAGTKLWEKTYGGSENDRAFAITLTRDGGALLAGYTESTGAGMHDMYLVRVDKDGSKLWEKTYGGSGNDRAYAITLTKDGGALLAGRIDSKDGIWVDMFLVRVDRDGTKLWEKTYGDENDEVVAAITLAEDGAALLAGTTDSKGAGKSDMFLVRVENVLATGE